MATMASAARDIPTSRRDNLTAVAAWSVPVARGHPDPLPTPPNSISPALPAHGLKAQLQKAARLEPIDSDLDLQDGQDDDHHSHEHPSHTGAVGVGSPPYEAAGAITPVMLAKFHLPEILLAHGPLAIRHIMGYLTSSVPGFAGIPPAKARRLVVGALEGRGSGGEGGGLDGDVEFEKVGWGRWDARRRNQPPRDPAARQGTPPYGAGIPIAKGGWDRSRLMAGSDEDSAAFSHDDRDITMLEHEADKMSMDGSGSASCSEAPDDDIVMNDDPEDVTDDEDWAAVGAAALRASSHQPGPDGHFPSSSVYTLGGGLRSTSGMARPPKFDLSASAFKGPSGEEERAAVAALLQLGSM
ncbi:hypothetical protein GQ53DRAFT_62353 [Thozetella sp. PMI_491]|nr:hypothetical protein GQ53DRAFT_62353 [Thozetella sp. PMI_491]